MLPLLPCCPWRNLSSEFVLKISASVRNKSKLISCFWILKCSGPNQFLYFCLGKGDSEYHEPFHLQHSQDFMIFQLMLLSPHHFSADLKRFLLFSEHHLCSTESASVLCHQFSHKPRLGPEPSAAPIFHVTEQRVFWEMRRSYGGNISLSYFAVNNKQRTG